MLDLSKEIYEDLLLWRAGLVSFDLYRELDERLYGRLLIALSRELTLNLSTEVGRYAKSLLG